MKKSILLSPLFICIFLIAMAKEGLTSPATAQGDNATQVEQLLKYLSYTETGDGDKVIYMFCGAQCPRCAQMYIAFEKEPMFKKEFQVRWVLYFGATEYLFPLEQKPGAGIKELYSNPKQIEPRQIEDPLRLETIVKYNDLLFEMIKGRFDGKPSVDSTPFIVFKTQAGFTYGSPEDLWKHSAFVSFAAALPLEEGIDIYATGIKDAIDIFGAALPLDGQALNYASGVKEAINKAEKLSGYIFFAVNNDAPLRLFPHDDAPLVAKPIPKGLGSRARTIIGKDWVGIQVYKDPDAPLAYAKAKDGQLKKE